MNWCLKSIKFLGSACTFPGLLATNRMATYPPRDVPIVFLTGGSIRLNLAGSLYGSKFPEPVPTT